MKFSEALANLNLITDLVPVGSSNRPQRKLAPTHITIHNTDNTSPGADARAHARFIKGKDAQKSQVSWHFTVDDKVCIKHLPVNEVGFHAKSGNSKSVGIEICHQPGIDFDAAVERASLLVAMLVRLLKVPEANIVPHKFWTGKNCPSHIFGKWPGGFPKFLLTVKSQLSNLPGNDAVAFDPEEIQLINELVDPIDFSFDPDTDSESESFNQVEIDTLPLESATPG